MKPSKSNRSLASFKSSKSLKTNLDSKRTDLSEILDLPSMIPTVCANLQVPFHIKVKKQQQHDEFYKAIKHGDASPRRKKLSILPVHATTVSQPPSDVKTVKSEDDKSGETETVVEEDAIPITAIYDTYNCLTEILLEKIKVPRILMQVIVVVAPYFQSLTTLTIRQCRVDYYTIHEICKVLELSTITNICLDNSPVPERSYEVVLNEHSCLRSLSLCKCKLNDDDCMKLAAKLHFGAPAENLQILNLSSNHITNIGAQFISDALRSNRHLRYLSLADNRITDEGALSLFNILMEFPLTSNEIFNMRRRYMKYLKRKQILYTKYLSECDEDELSQKKSIKKKKTARKDKDFNEKLSRDDNVRDRAEILANELLGQFTDPFDSISVQRRDNCYYCAGNMVLCYLNLSYNNLSYLMIKKLVSLVMYQNVARKGNQPGIIKLLIEGNNLPMCKELALLNELLSRNLKHVYSKTEVKRRRSRALSLLKSDF